MRKRLGPDLRRGWFLGRALIARLLRRNMWGMIDHGLLSVSNFVTTVVAARALGDVAFGAFTLVYSLIFVATRIGGSLIIQPQYVLGAVYPREQRSRYTSSNGGLQIMLAAVTTALVLLGGAVAIGIRSPYATLLLALAPAMCFWQLQSFVRSTMYAEERPGAALLNDLIAYGAQAVLFIACWKVSHLTGEGALLIVGGTSVVATLVGVAQLRGVLGRQFDRAVFRENWEFGKWLLADRMGAWFASEAFLYLLAAVLGSAAAGILKAANTLFGPLRILGFFLGTILPIRFSKAMAREGESGLGWRVWTTTALTLPIVGGYCALVVIFAKPLTRLLFGTGYGEVSSILALIAVMWFVEICTDPFAQALEARRQTRARFIARVPSVIISIPVGWFLIKLDGIEGAAIGLLVGAVVAAAMYFWMFRQTTSPFVKSEAGEAASSVQAI